MSDQTMRAAICTAYGPPDVLQIKTIPVPQPKDNELRIAVKATAVTASDIFIRSMDVPLRFEIPMRLLLGLTKPRRPVLGLVFAGVVDMTGSDVRRFRAGDRIYGMAGFRFGAYAEFLCLREKDSKAGCISHLPDEISFDTATSAVYGGSLAMQYMERGHISPGHRILIYGASGTSGTFAVQYGKHLGAHVTAVCGPRNLDFMRSLGADEVLDYTVTNHLPEGTEYDFILDSVGELKSSPLKDACRNALSPDGVYESIDNGNLILSSERLDRISRLVTEGAVSAIVGRTFPFEQIAEAHEFVQRGHKRGGVAILVND